MEFAAFERSLIEPGPDRYEPIGNPAPISQPSQHSAHWLLAGAAMAIFTALMLWLLSSGLLASYLAAALRIVAPA